MRQHRCDYCEARLRAGQCSERCDESERERQGYQAEYDAGIACFARGEAPAYETSEALHDGWRDARETAERERYEREREEREGLRERRAEVRHDAR